MSRPCPKCASDAFDLGPGPGKDENRKATCRECGGVWWQPKAENEKAKRPAAHRLLVAKSGITRCQLCNRLESELPGDETLEGHHVVEYSDGGTDDPSNVWIVCTPCHRFIHHQRTYLGHYHRAAG